MAEADAAVTAEDQNGICQIRISHPGKRNALTWQMYDQLSAIAAAVNERDDLRVVVLRGDPVAGFAAGTDIGQFRDFASGEDGLRYERDIGQVIESVAKIKIPVVAAVQGTAAGAGLVLASCADLVVAERGARFGAPIARTLGNCLPAAALARLRSRVGIPYANAMIIAGALIAAEDLTGCGFVHRLAEPGQLDAALEPIVGSIASSAPRTLRAVKELNRRLESTTPLPEDTDLLLSCYRSADFAEGVDAFLNHRPPQWTGQ